ncbi:MAG: hypothetical protein ACK5CL_00750 [Sphingomonadales bacterium]|jgi:hypothetical protein
MTEQQYKELLNLIADYQTQPFYSDTAFWISTVIGIIGVYLSFIAFKEAREAKQAAKAAGSVVRLQSITIDLTEIIQRLDKLSTELNYSETRDFFNELNRRVRRSISILTTDTIYSSKTSEILATLVNIKTNLDNVRQNGTADQTLLAGTNLYYAIEGEFSSLSGQLADLCGLLEQKTLEQ